MQYITEFYNLRSREIDLPDVINPGEEIFLLPERDLLNKKIVSIAFIPFSEDAYSFDRDLLTDREFSYLAAYLSDELDTERAANSFAFYEVPLLFFFEPRNTNMRFLATDTSLNFELSKVKNLANFPIDSAGRKLKYIIQYID